MDQRWQIHIGDSGFQEFCLSVHFCYKEKWYDLSDWKNYLASRIRTRIQSGEIKLFCQKLFYFSDILKTTKLSN